ncbi:MAG TPA: BadF/BadG/BcrA/BcrD ATPase family protein [Gemmatimonadaceae bacterium]|nr:BadF/BadG/BcrA/BcrD ATPase family protein [Gemmatimonadaceae bacterium]
MTLIVVGVDGGGTKTRVTVANEAGEEIVSVEGPGSAVRPGEAERSADIILATVRDALEAAAMPHVVPKVACVGVAGVGREVERDALWQALVSRDLAEDVVVHADATIALDDAFGDGAGILLIAGTGSVAFARGPSGAVARCGGWGSVIGDEGGGAWIGRRALSVVAAASDGREPTTTLIGAVLTAAQLDSAEALIPWAATATPAQLATLAPAVLQAAEAGDLRANSILSIAAEELMLHVRTLARQLFADERAAVPVALAGGLLKRGAPLRRRLEHRLKTAVAGAQVRAEDVVPSRGAVRGALRFLGIEQEA